MSKTIPLIRTAQELQNLRTKTNSSVVAAVTLADWPTIARPLLDVSISTEVKRSVLSPNSSVVPDKGVSIGETFIILECVAMPIQNELERVQTNNIAKYK